MHNYKIVIEYDGTNFVGWQQQENGQSIQSTLQEALFKLTGENISIFGAGRTDAGVHSRGQVAHFETNKNIPIKDIRDGLNQHLRKLPIAILKSELENEKFDARFSAKMRNYQYRIIDLNKSIPPVMIGLLIEGVCILISLRIADPMYF